MKLKMSDKKGGIAVEEITGIVIFMFAAIIAFVFFAACSVSNVKKEYEELKFSKDELEAKKDLNFFLEMDVDEERNVMDLIIESYSKEDYTEFDSITKEHFSDIYSDWRFIIFSKHKTFYESRKASAVGYVNKLVIAEEYLPVSKGAEDFEFIRVILYIYE